MKILGISGSIIGNKTSSAVQMVLNNIGEQDDSVETDLLDMAQYNVEFSTGKDYSDYEGDTREVIERVLSADAFIIGSPTYQASISGVLKNLFDLLPLDTFRNKVTGIVITAGSDKHYLMAEYHLKPILQYMGALVVPKYVFVNEVLWIRDQILDQDILSRTRQLAADVLSMARTVDESIG